MNNNVAAPFGQLLRSWRSERHLSQAALAAEIETPARHISFLETGRSKPSRSMVARLATALNVPLREQNRLLEAAGFANAYPASELSDAEMRTLRHTVQRLMRAHDPFPSFVIDRSWNIQDANDSGGRLMQTIEPHFVAKPPEQFVNMVEAVFSLHGFRPMIKNWDAYAPQLIARLHRESLSDDDLHRTLDRIRADTSLPQRWWSLDTELTRQPSFPIEMRVNGQAMTFFTVVAAVALPTSMLAQELRVETMFPANPETERLLLAGYEY